MNSPHPIVMTAAPGRWDLQPIVPGVSTAYARRNRPNSIAAVAANPSTRNGISRPVETLTAETIPVTTGSAPTSTTSPSVIAIARTPPRTPPSGATRKMTASARLARRDRADAVHRSATKLTTPSVALAPVRLANCSFVPGGSSNGNTSSASPISARPTSDKREGGQEQLVGERGSVRAHVVGSDPGPDGSHERCQP